MRPQLRRRLFQKPPNKYVSDPFPAYYWIPPFTHPDVDGVTFGGFMVGRFLASQPNAYNAGDIGGGRYGDNPDVADSSSVGSVAASTRQGVPPWRYISMLEARKACANIGVGYHLITRFEWASLAMWCHLNGFQPHGNNRNTKWHRRSERQHVEMERRSIIAADHRLSVHPGYAPGVSGPCSVREIDGSGSRIADR